MHSISRRSRAASRSGGHRKPSCRASRALSPQLGVQVRFRAVDSARSSKYLLIPMVSCNALQTEFHMPQPKSRMLELFCADFEASEPQSHETRPPPPRCHSFAAHAAPPVSSSDGSGAVNCLPLRPVNLEPCSGRTWPMLGLMEQGLPVRVLQQTVDPKVASWRESENSRLLATTPAKSVQQERSEPHTNCLW